MMMPWSLVPATPWRSNSSIMMSCWPAFSPMPPCSGGPARAEPAFFGELEAPDLVRRASGGASGAGGARGTWRRPSRGSGGGRRRSERSASGDWVIGVFTSLGRRAGRWWCRPGRRGRRR
jgi:hypothetical protein